MPALLAIPLAWLGRHWLAVGGVGLALAAVLAAYLWAHNRGAASRDREVAAIVAARDAALAAQRQTEALLAAERTRADAEARAAAELAALRAEHAALVETIAGGAVLILPGSPADEVLRRIGGG